jgi:hypothetical protein
LQPSDLLFSPLQFEDESSTADHHRLQTLLSSFVPALSISDISTRVNSFAPSFFLFSLSHITTLHSQLHAIVNSTASDMAQFKREISVSPLFPAFNGITQLPPFISFLPLSDPSLHRSSKSLLPAVPDIKFLLPIIETTGQDHIINFESPARNWEA